VHPAADTGVTSPKDVEAEATPRSSVASDSRASGIGGTCEFRTGIARAWGGCATHVDTLPIAHDAAVGGPALCR
jgi:hypothetical protein